MFFNVNLHIVFEIKKAYKNGRLMSISLIYYMIGANVFELMKAMSGFFPFDQIFPK
jgi:hypothetical protein